MYKYLIVLFLVIILFISFNKEKPYVNKLKQSDTILAFGDSITYGFGSKRDESYPYLLAESTKLRVINAGVNGDTSKEGLARLPSLLDDNSIKLLLLCFGGNDLLQKKSTDELKKNLKQIIQLAKAKNISVILISVPDLSFLGLNPLDLYKELSEEEDVELIEGLLSHVLSHSSLKSDYIHPNSLGYKYIADGIYTHLKSHRWIE